MHNGPSRVFVPRHLESSEVRYWDYSLLALTNVQDGPLWLWRSIMSFCTPTLGQNSSTFFSSNYLLTAVDPYRPSQSRRTVVGSVGGRSAISAQNLRVLLWTYFLEINKKPNQKSIQKGFRHTLNLRKRHWKYRETMVHQHPQLIFLVFPQLTHYDSLQNLCTRLSIF